MIFQQEYSRPDGKEDHVFLNLQQWYNNKVNSMLGIEVPAKSPEASNSLSSSSRLSLVTNESDEKKQ